MLGAVNYLTGQWFDMQTITRAGHDAGAVVGWDLVHAMGNVPMKLHDWGADFAAWCSYKYLNAGPGAVAGAFVHEKHLSDPTLPRFEGWWGNDPATRFKMGPKIEAMQTADAWSLSNPPIFSLTPLKASLELFDRATMPALRAKALKLIGYMGELLKAADLPVSSLTPADTAHRGCQWSLVVPGSSKVVQQALIERGVVCDFREPNVIRAAPTPLYNSFHDVWRFVRELQVVLKS
jgi:kynureninase